MLSIVELRIHIEEYFKKKKIEIENEKYLRQKK